MPAAARVGDPTSHPGVIGPLRGVLSVLIEKQPAAVVGTQHICALPPPGSHPATAIGKGSMSVHIGGKPAARVGDSAACGAIITQGARSVLIGG